VIRLFYLFAVLPKNCHTHKVLKGWTVAEFVSQVPRPIVDIGCQNISERSFLMLLWHINVHLTSQVEVIDNRLIVLL
jgi:hypothetical protein